MTEIVALLLIVIDANQIHDRKSYKGHDLHLIDELKSVKRAIPPVVVTP